MKTNKKIKLIASTASARLGTVLFSVALVAIVASLIAQGILTFTENVAVTIGSIAAVVVISIVMFIVNFGGYLFFDLGKKQLTLCRNFKKTIYPLELVYKLQLEMKTIDLHVLDKTTEQEIESGNASIKQRVYKKVNYKMPSRKNLDQRKRYEVFAEKCNKILTEVVHKKQVVEIFRGATAKAEETK